MNKCVKHKNLTTHAEGASFSPVTDMLVDGGSIY